MCIRDRSSSECCHPGRCIERPEGDLVVSLFSPGSDSEHCARLKHWTQKTEQKRIRFLEHPQWIPDLELRQYPDRYDDVVVFRSKRAGLLYRSVLCGSFSIGNRELHRALRTEKKPAGKRNLWATQPISFLELQQFPDQHDFFPASTSFGSSSKSQPALPTH